MSRGVKDLRDNLNRSRRSSPANPFPDSSGDFDLRTQLVRLSRLSQHDQELIKTLQENLSKRRDELEQRDKDLTDLQRNVERMSIMGNQQRQELEQLREETKEHKKKLEEKVAEVAVVQEQLIAEQIKAQELKEKTTQLESRNVSLETETASQTKQIQELKLQLEELIGDSEGGLAHLREENAKLREDRKLELQKWTQENEELANRMRLANDFLQAEKEVSRAITKQKEDIEQNMILLEKNVDDLELKLQKKELELQEAVAGSRSALSDTLSHMEERHRKAREELQAVISKLTDGKAAAESKTRDLESQMRGLTKDLETSKEETARVTKRLEDYESSLAVVTQLKNENLQLKNDLEKVKREANADSMRLAEADAENARLEGKVRRLTAEVEQLKGENGEHSRAIGKDLKISEERCKALQLEVDDLRKQLGENQIQKDDMARITLQLNQTEREANTLRKRILDLQETEKEVRDAVAKLSHAQEGMEAHFTCIVCLDLFKAPAMTDCGHTVCRTCIQSPCQECQKPIDKSRSVPNELLDQLSGKRRVHLPIVTVSWNSEPDTHTHRFLGKFVYAQQVLAKLRNGLVKESPVF